MSSLRARLGELLLAVPRGARVALLDDPVHRNVGDLFVLLGTESFLAEHEMSVVYRASVHDYRPSKAARSIDRRTIVLCAGGGNLGDLYPSHQRLRERVVADFPGNRIVILPQTIWFRTEEALLRAARSFQGHPDLHLFVRDERSLRTARSRLCGRSELLPDMAHQLWPIERPVADTPAGTLYISRRDRERPAGSDAPPGSESWDWGDLFGPAEHALLGLCAGAQKVGWGFGRRLWTGEARRLVDRAVARVSRYERIVTSRLHGGLLALLLGRRCELVDNSYGKVGGYYSAWLADVPGCRMGDGRTESEVGSARGSAGGGVR